MVNRTRIFFDFVSTVIKYVVHVREAIIALLLLIALGGFVFSKVEETQLSDGLYFAFITALSIGYGDIHPATPLGKVVSVGIGLVGMLFVGITVAITTRALADTTKRYMENRS